MKFILAIDSGTTGIRAVILDKQGNIVASEYEKTPALYPQSGWIEHDPISLWEALLSVVQKLSQNYGIKFQEIAAIGITNQRASFTLWERETGKPIINFINWADIRSVETCNLMNKNKVWRIIKKIAWIVSKITKNPMLTATSILDFTTDHVTVRLKWVLDNTQGLRERCKKGEIAFGTIDSWFIYRLTGMKTHSIDYSNAATGLLNPFQLKWNTAIFRIFNIPFTILPDLKDSNGDFGVTDPQIFNGIEIPIRAVIGDQQAALFGQCCFEAGNVKISLGSGAFVDINVGNKGKISKRGLFPLVAWVIDGKPTYMLEGFVATAGTLIDWIDNEIGIYETPDILNEYAEKCEDTEGVIFVPTLCGIKFPYFDSKMKANILGLSLKTQKSHVARAVFEGIAFRIVDILEGIEYDTKVKINTIKTDGGVSKSDILLQSIANFTGLEIKRSSEIDMTVTGAAFLAGLNIGFWKNKSELKEICDSFQSRIFHPNISKEKKQQKIKQWRNVINSLVNIDNKY